MRRNAHIRALAFASILSGCHIFQPDKFEGDAQPGESARDAGGYELDVQRQDTSAPLDSVTHIDTVSLTAGSDSRTVAASEDAGGYALDAQRRDISTPLDSVAQIDTVSPTADVNSQAVASSEDASIYDSTVLLAITDASPADIVGPKADAPQDATGGLDSQAESVANCAGSTLCNDRCVDLNTDQYNCGSCGNECPAGSGCDGAGKCAVICSSGTTNCNGTCANLSTDSTNCGFCGGTCSPGTICNGSGTCAPSCQSGLQACNGHCVDPSVDPTNCGACSNKCSFPNATATCVSGTCQLGLCVSGYVDVDRTPSNGCECEITNGGQNICDGIDHACNGLIDYNIVNGLPVSTCQCSDQILSLSSYVGECGSCTSCAEPQCSITNDGQDSGMSYTLGECASGAWAQCEFNSVNLNAFDADHGDAGILEISLTVVEPVAGQTLNAVGIYYGAYPGRKRLSFFTEQELSQGVTAGSYTRYFRPSDAVCQGAEAGIPAACAVGCTNGQWSSDGPECVFDFDDVPLWVAAEFSNNLAVTATLQGIEVHYLTGPVCTCQQDSDCRDPTRPVCDLGSLVCVPS